MDNFYIFLSLGEKKRWFGSWKHNEEINRREKDKTMTNRQKLLMNKETSVTIKIRIVKQWGFSQWQCPDVKVRH